MDEFNDRSWEYYYENKNYYDYNYSNMNYNFNATRSNYEEVIHLNDLILKWINWISIGIGLPLTLVVMIAVFSQVKKDQGAPVYVINLLLSDLLQLCCRIPMDLSRPELIYCCILLIGAIASVEFMICISLERYLVIAKPLWYRFRRNLKTSVLVCVVVWILPFLFLVTVFLTADVPMGIIVIAYFLLLPFPFFIFFLVGTIKVLSGALSVPPDEKRRIAAIQVAVLLIYTLLFLPIIILLLLNKSGPNDPIQWFRLTFVAFFCVSLSPLADTTLYLLIRKSVLDRFLASLCSCKTSNNQDMGSTDYERRIATNTETV